VFAVVKPITPDTDKPRQIVGELIMSLQHSALSRTSPAIGSRAFSDLWILVARVLIGLIFVQSGWSKLMTYSGSVTSLVQRGVPEFFAYLAPPVEFFSGVAVVLGLFTAPAAAFMVLFTIAATLVAHRFWEYADPGQYRIQSTNFWKNVSMIGGMLLLFVTSGGRFSLDALLFDPSGPRRSDSVSIG
jgi:putative oxidoreductase